MPPTTGKRSAQRSARPFLLTLLGQPKSKASGGTRPADLELKEKNLSYLKRELGIFVSISNMTKAALSNLSYDTLRLSPARS